MKKATAGVLVSIFLSLTLPAQDVIENKDAKLGPNAGRVVTLKDEMRIEDTGEGFYFKNPLAIRVSPKGDVFIRDGQEQALLFDAQGKFVKNLLKKGQGPGELTTLLDVWASQDRLYITGYPLKVLVFRYDGGLEKELTLRAGDIWEKFVSAGPEGILLRKQNRPDLSGGDGIKEIPQDVVEISSNDAAAKTIVSIPIPVFVRIMAGGVSGMTSWNQLQAVVLDQNSLVLNSTPDYLLALFARDQGTITRRFRRPYTRVKRTGGGGISGSGGPAPAPPEFQNDIFALHAVDGKIWVQTSTVGEKGILFDVFDPQGRYLDCFFIQAASKDPSGKPVNRTVTIMNGFIYFREKTADDLIVIKKCRLVGL